MRLFFSRKCLFLLAPMLLGAAPGARLEIRIDNLRNSAGSIRACLAPAAAAFPDCSTAHGRALSVGAGAGGVLVFENLPHGRYAIAVLHDENGNRKLDTLLGVPREGFGFSRNPAVGFGPPSFSRASFEVAGSQSAQRVRMRYLL
jgi:uncharacterized protein (DUF2141 family)